MNRLRPKFEICVRVGLCLLVLVLTSLDAVHNHGPVSALGANPPQGGQHCVLCMAAHLPLAVSASTAAPAPVFTTAMGTPGFYVEPAREQLSGSSLCTRPPPLA